MVLARVYPILMAGLAWFAVGLQFYITTTRSLSAGKTLIGTIVFLLSFFTIVTNLLIAMILTLPVAAPRSRASGFFSRPGVLSAVLAYIVMVGISYNLLLRHLWSPKGAEWLADEMLHVVVPALYVLHWIALVPKGTLRFGQIWKWMLYPTAYVVFALVRGGLLGQYPYPFLDAGVLGIWRVLMNVSGLLVGFLAISICVVAVDHVMGPGKRSSVGRRFS